MVEAQSKAGHARPAFLERVEKGVYRVKGSEIRVRQEAKGWKVTGHDELASETFASRHAASERIEALGLVPEVPAEQPVQPEADKQPVLDPGDASGADGTNGSTDRRPRARKPRAKAGAKV